MTASELKVGCIYSFQIKDWIAPTGQAIPGAKDKRRIFIRHTVVDNIPFVEVQREIGKLHLIAVETIEAIRQVTWFH